MSAAQQSSLIKPIETAMVCGGKIEVQRLELVVGEQTYDGIRYRLLSKDIDTPDFLEAAEKAYEFVVAAGKGKVYSFFEFSGKFPLHARFLSEMRKLSGTKLGKEARIIHTFLYGDETSMHAMITLAHTGMTVFRIPMSFIRKLDELPAEVAKVIAKNLLKK